MRSLKTSKNEVFFMKDLKEKEVSGPQKKEVPG
jgi:hypothetical protein